MNAINKKRISKTQRDTIDKAINQAYIKKSDEVEQKCLDRFSLFFQLAMCLVLDENYNFGEKRRKKILEEVARKSIEISEWLCSNLEEKDGKRDYSTEYNQQKLFDLANYYGLDYPKDVFEDVELC